MRKNSETLVLKVPPVLADGLEKASAKNLTSKSEYVRQLIVAALRKDGLLMVAA